MEHMHTSNEVIGLQLDFLDQMGAALAAAENPSWVRAWGEIMVAAQPESENIAKVVGDLDPPSKPGDVGYNLRADKDYVIRPGEFCQVFTGTRIQAPPGLWYMVLPRSSANRTGKLIVLPGVIDGGYRGEITAMVHHSKSSWARRAALWVLNLFRKVDDCIYVRRGDALCQVVFFPIITPKLEYVLELDPSERGESAYGSTGNGVRTSR